MSGRKDEPWVPPPEVWTSSTISRSISLSMTSAAAMFDALKEVGCQVKTDLPAARNVLKRQQDYQESLDRLNELQPNSLDASVKFEEAINRSIEASNALKEAKELATAEAPDKIEFTDKNGVQRTMTKRSGAYRLTWQETVETSSKGRSRENHDRRTRQFSNELKIANDKCQIARKENEENAMAHIKSRNEELFKQLEHAIGIKSRWEAIEEARRVENFRQEVAGNIEKSSDELGYKYRRIVDSEEEIVISVYN